MLKMYTLLFALSLSSFAQASTPPKTLRWHLPDGTSHPLVLKHIQTPSIPKAFTSYAQVELGPNSQEDDKTFNREELWLIAGIDMLIILGCFGVFKLIVYISKKVQLSFVKQHRNYEKKKQIEATLAQRGLVVKNT